MLKTIAAVLVTLTPVAVAGQTMGYASSPPELISEVGGRGAAPVVRELYESESWKAVLRAIASGEAAWLLAAVAISPGADGGAASELFEFLSRALLENPSGVLEIFQSTTPASGICSASVEFDNYDAAADELRRKISRVRSAKGTFSES